MKKQLLIILAILVSTMGYSQFWNLEGNLNTNSSENFVGTLDENPLILKANKTEGIRILPSGNVRIGANIDPITNSATFRIYNSFIPSFELANTYGRFEILKSACSNCGASGAIEGDAVLRNLGNSHNTILYIPNDSNDATSYIGVGDDSNKIWAKFLNNRTLNVDGKVLIGSTSISSCLDCSNYRLFVKDGIKTEKIKVEFSEANSWADYVFNEDYKLMPLPKLQEFISENKHLPEIPSAEHVITNGVELKEMNVLLLKKIEELTIYIIDINDKLRRQEDIIKQLEKK